MKIAVRLVLMSILAGPPMALFAASWSAASRPQVWPSWTRYLFKIQAGALEGISGDTEFSINRFGLRGRPWRSSDSLRIVALGGSTTQCTFLDDAETWTTLLESEIDRTGGSAWVGNGGRSGLSMREHVIQVEPILRLTRPDWLILMVGVNDLLRCLAGVTYENRGAQRPFERAFLEPGEAFTKLTPLAHLRATARAVRRRVSPRREVPVGAGIRADRKRRQDGTRIYALPNIEPDLIAYEALLWRTIELARADRVRLVLVTQAHRWGHENGRFRAKQWLGWAGCERAADAVVYYSSEVLAHGIDLINARTKVVGEKAGVTVVDLAGSGLDPATCFYDGVHLNEAGARRVAEILASSVDWWSVGE